MGGRMRRRPATRGRNVSRPGAFPNPLSGFGGWEKEAAGGLLATGLGWTQNTHPPPPGGLGALRLKKGPGLRYGRFRMLISPEPYNGNTSEGGGVGRVTKHSNSEVGFVAGLVFIYFAKRHLLGLIG